MATATNVIRVSIVGDAKKLIDATKQADKATSGLLSSSTKALGAIAVGAVSVDQAFSFINTSLGEADRLGDAIFNLENQLGDLAKPLEDAAGGFARIGASKQDIIELEATFANFGTAVGLSKDQMAAFADDAAATATALALVRDEDPTALLDLITKAAGGSDRAARDLGVSLLDTKDSGAQLANILAQLKPTLDAATTGTGDLEQKQKELQARTETLSAAFGEKLNPVLNEMLGNLLQGIDVMPVLTEKLRGLAPSAFPNLGTLVEMLGGIGKFFDQNHSTNVRLNFSSNLSDQAMADALARNRARNGTSTLGRDP